MTENGKKTKMVDFCQRTSRTDSRVALKLVVNLDLFVFKKSRIKRDYFVFNLFSNRMTFSQCAVALTISSVMRQGLIA